MSAVRVLVADDHPTFARALRVLFEHDDHIDIVATAGDGAEAVELALVAQPDVVLMDVHMPGVNGVDATRQITEAMPHVAVVMLTMFDDDDRVADAIRAGARGYLLKGARRDEIRRAIDAVRAGEAVLGAGVARRLAAILSSSPPAASDPRRAFPHLTARELDVLDRLAAGLDNAGIARALQLSEKTVRNYVSLVLTKLQVQTRTEAALIGRDAGLG
jgi:DNA-binding NarL/FixJ family response regulator